VHNPVLFFLLYLSLFIVVIIVIIVLAALSPSRIIILIITGTELRNRVAVLSVISIYNALYIYTFVPTVRCQSLEGAIDW